MIWDEVQDSLMGAIRAGCQVSHDREMGLVFHVQSKFGYPLGVRGSTPESRGAVVDWLTSCLQDMTDARPFCFENVPVTYDETCVVMPGPEDEEVAFFNEGLVPMPFPLIWVEVATSRDTIGLLVRETEEGIDIVEFSRVRSPGGATVIQVYPWRQQMCRLCDDPKVLGLPAPGEIPLPREQMITKGIIDELGLAEAYEREEAVRVGLPFDSPDMVGLMTRECDLLIYLLVMLGSRSTECETVAAPKFQNRRRKDKGLRPIPDRMVIRIVPRRVADRMRADGESIHASPRMHWRRSHTRNLADGRRILVSRCLVGFRAMNGDEVLERTYMVA